MVNRSKLFHQLSPKLVRLKHVLLLERFFETLPENIKLLLIDKEPTTLEEAVRLADSYAVNHKVYARPS